jgi:3-dehydroquinate dehydratase-2
MGGTILVLNGPNLNLLGEREPHIYGHETLADVKAMCEAEVAGTAYAIDFRQTNAEHEAVD